MRLSPVIYACYSAAFLIVTIPERIAPDVKELKLTPGDEFGIGVNIIPESRRAIARCGVHGFYYGAFVERDGRPRYEQRWFRNHPQLSHFSSRVALSDKRGVYSITCFATFDRRGQNGNL